MLPYLTGQSAVSRRLLLPPLPPLPLPPPLPPPLPLPPPRWNARSSDAACLVLNVSNYKTSFLLYLDATPPPYL